jgi:hypothetical protein
MNCREALLDIDALVDGELADRRALDAHLAACAVCAHELESRRAFSDDLRNQFRPMRDLTAPAADKAALVDRLAARPRTSMLWLRAAAIVIVGLSIGFLGVTLNRRTPDAPPNPAAVQLAEVSALENQAKLRRVALKNEADELKHQVARNGGTEEAGRALSFLIMNINRELAGDQTVDIEIQGDAREQVDRAVELIVKSDPRGVFALRKLGSDHLVYLKDAEKRLDGGDYHILKMKIESMSGSTAVSVPAGAEPCINIVQSIGNRSVKFQQYPNAVVVLECDGRKVVAADMTALLSEHRDLCAKAGVAGSDGKVQIGGVQSVSLGVVRSAPRMWEAMTMVEWPEIAEEADRAVFTVYSKKKNEAAARRLRDEAAKAREAVTWSDRVEIAAEVEQALARVKSLNDQEVRRLQRDAAKRAEELRRQLGELKEIQGRLESVKVYVQALRSLDK